MCDVFFVIDYYFHDFRSFLFQFLFLFFQRKINNLQTELVKAKREATKTKMNKNKNELFPGAKQKDMISTSALRPPSNKDRTGSPAAAGSRSVSPYKGFFD